MAIVKKTALLGTVDKKTLAEVEAAETRINRFLKDNYCGSPVTVTVDRLSEKAKKELEKRLKEAGFAIIEEWCSRDCEQNFIKIG